MAHVKEANQYKSLMEIKVQEATMAKESFDQQIADKNLIIETERKYNDKLKLKLSELEAIIEQTDVKEKGIY